MSLNSTSRPLGLPFHPHPDESEKAFDLFFTYLEMGPDRSLQNLAKSTKSKLGTLKRWSRRFDWNGRIHAWREQILRVKFEADVKSRQEHAHLWRERANLHKQSEWALRENVIHAARDILEKILAKESDALRPTDAARLIEVASKLGRLACDILPPGKAQPIPEDPGPDPFIAEFTAALEKVYGENCPTPEQALSKPPTPKS